MVKLFLGNNMNDNKNTIPAWECPKCGATHPITVNTCCQPKDPKWVPEDKRPNITKKGGETLFG